MYMTDSFGRQQPIEALIYSDAMTESMGSTPKIGSTRHSKPGKQIKNRLFTVQVICGAACQFYMNISVDQLIAGGANLSIEIQRIAMEVLGKELAKLGQVLPRIINFQFDNCGENKNKEMFAYFSALIEQEIFDEIRVNFLIVGHTHSNLDQYFSVYSKKIRKSDYIASPLAMHELYNSAHNILKHPDMEPRRHELEFLRFTHDWVTYFGPVLNKKLVWYKIPHCFRLTRVAGRAICQTQVFSPENDGDAVWNPPQPLKVKANLGASAADYTDDVHFEPFVSVESSNLVLQEMGVTAEAVTRDLTDGVNHSSSIRAQAEQNKADAAVKNLHAFNEMRKELQELELAALSSMMHNMHLQRNADTESVDGSNSPESDDDSEMATGAFAESESEATAAAAVALRAAGMANRRLILQKELHKRMTAFNNQQEGYILWLDYTKLPPGVSMTSYLSHRPPLLPPIPSKYRTIEESPAFPYAESLTSRSRRKKDDRAASLKHAVADIANVAVTMLAYSKVQGNSLRDTSDKRSIRSITGGFHVR